MLTRLQADSALMLEFLAFAAERGRLDPIKFAVRLNNTTGQKRPPSTFTALVLLEFGVEKGLVEASKNGGGRRQ